MKVQDLQTEIASHGYGPTLVKYWEIIQRENKDILPHDTCHWRQVWRAAKDKKEDIRQEAAKHLFN